MHTGVVDSHMDRTISTLSRWVTEAGPIALVLVLANCAQPAATASVAMPPIPAGEARVWFYRDYEPYAGKGLPAIEANGGYVGVAGDRLGCHSADPGG